MYLMRKRYHSHLVDLLKQRQTHLQELFHLDHGVLQETRLVHHPLELHQDNQANGLQIGIHQVIKHHNLAKAQLPKPALHLVFQVDLKDIADMVSHQAVGADQEPKPVLHLPELHQDNQVNGLLMQNHKHMVKLQPEPALETYKLLDQPGLLVLLSQPEPPNQPVHPNQPVPLSQPDLPLDPLPHPDHQSEPVGQDQSQTVLPLDPSELLQSAEELLGHPLVLM